jgi:hypothetical protein
MMRLGLAFVLLCGCARGSELFAPAPIDEVGARYAARAGSGLNTPIVLTLPDWDKTPVADGAHVHLLVQCLLDPLPNLPAVRDRGAMLRDLPVVTVACYAQRGDYSPGAFVSGLRKIEAYMKARNIPQVGPPRYLYYTTTSWMPSWWRVGEVQVPIAAGAGG